MVKSGTCIDKAGTLIQGGSAFYLHRDRDEQRSAQDEHLAMFSGADAYMRKPFDPEELVFEVEQLLARHREAH